MKLNPLEERQLLKLQQRNSQLQGYQGYLATCNALIVLVDDILANDNPGDDKKAELVARRAQVEQDAAYARDNIYRILDDMLDRRPKAYAPSIVEV